LGLEQFTRWAFLGEEIAKLSRIAAKEYFKSSPEVIKKIDPCDIEQWARLGIHLIKKSPSIKAEYGAHSLLAQGSGAGKAKKLDLATQYFKSAPQILSRLSIRDLEQWVEKGLKVTDDQKEKGNAFFSLQTGKSLKAVEGLVKGLELKEIHRILRSYAEALTGKRILIRLASLFYKNISGLDKYFSVTDGTRIFLPSNIAIFQDQELNFKTYKLALLHEIGHLLFDTFAINSRDLKKLSASVNPILSLKIFELLEDERVDYLLGSQYPGLEKDRMSILQSYLLQKNDQMEEMPVFEFLSLNSLLKIDGADFNTADDHLTQLLQKALSKVKQSEFSSHDVLDLTVQTCRDFENCGDIATCGSREIHGRLFYRGVLDFTLVENTRSEMSRLIFVMAERLSAKEIKATPEQIEEAFNRIEESEALESEVALWQIDASEKLEELFERIQQVLADMKSEKYLRRMVYYDEWDNKLDDYKREWCRVREMDMPGASPALFYDRAIEEYYGMVSLLRRYFGLLRPDRIQRFFREERGDDIDFDALIESVVDRYAAVTPSDGVYIRREKNLRDVSVAFLVDMSYSTGDVLPSGKRIIDVEREGLVLMAEALENLGDQWAVYGFSTNRRDMVDFSVVRDFDKPFDDEVKMRFESMRPMAQTRLGAVIRHANRLLERRLSRIRLLILLSDGRPYDIDYGDADYAVEDTRRALWEGRRKGINCFCVTVDKKSRDYLPYMYGESNYILIENLDALPSMLPLIYKRLTT
ncbi:MAG: nitric oxide reductase activation protein NorD, partial [Desulfobacterales bacterium]